MDKNSPCGSGLGPGSSSATGGKGQQPRSNSAGPAGGSPSPKGIGAVVSVSGQAGYISEDDEAQAGPSGYFPLPAAELDNEELCMHSESDSQSDDSDLDQEDRWLDPRFRRFDKRRCQLEGKNASGSRQRYNRKRETSYPKNETFPSQSRRSFPQKSKTFNKMPPQRGEQNSGGKSFSLSSNGGRRDEVAETQRAEFSPAQFSGPKKINLNHLLNFTFEPRGHTSHFDGSSHGTWGKRNRWENKPFNKELFLQANCQFVVRDDQDYTVHFTDPDTLVNWDFVQQVRIYSHEVPSCPICLYPPTAAKITRCGHIFCWACILHYLSLSEKTWSKCPICYGSIHKKDLKSVVALETRQYAIGDTITMHLMQRKKGALIALPKSALAHVEQPVRLGDKPHSQYSKLLLASEGQVLQQVILEEKMALLHQYQEEKHTPEACFIEAALQELKDREGNLMCDSDVPDVTAAVEKLVVTETSKKEMAAVPQENKCMLEYDELLESPPMGPANGNPPALDSAEAAADNGMERNTDPASASEAGEAILSASASGKPKAAFASGHTQSPPSYYFYQAEDGQCLYLHPVNVRCLVHEYGSLEKSPEKITATVVEISGHSMTEDVRQRHRYLRHLPLTCEFSICELALKSPVVSKETLQMFSDDIEKRKRLRQKKARDERRREHRIEMEEKKKQGKYPEVRIALENLQQFPAFSAGSGEPAGLENESHMLPACVGGSPTSQSESLLTPLSSSSLGSPPFLIGSLEEDPAFPSFAQMLRAGKAKPELWNGSQPKKKEETPTGAPPAPGDSDVESDSSDRVPVPSFQNSFSKAIEAAFLKLDTPSTSDHLLEEKRGKKKEAEAKTPVQYFSGSHKVILLMGKFFLLLIYLVCFCVLAAVDKLF